MGYCLSRQEASATESGKRPRRGGTLHDAGILNNGEKGNWMTFELVGYTDPFLEHLGLKIHWKGWFRNLFEPCRTSDFKSLKEEYLDKYEKREEIVTDGGTS